MKKSGRRFLIGGVVIGGAVTALVVTGMNAATLRAVPVHEVRLADETPKTFVGQRLRLVGFVSHDPLKREAIQTPSGVVEIAHFTIEDRGKTVQVAYRDALPDTFRAGGPVQVDGTYAAGGKIEAEHVLTKCPSKYDELKEDPKKAGAKGNAKDGSKGYDKKAYDKKGADEPVRSAVAPREAVAARFANNVE